MMKQIETVCIGKRCKNYRIVYDTLAPWNGYKVYTCCICVGGARTLKDARKLAQIDYDIFYRRNNNDD